jgi:hypothetical protein
MEGDISRKNNSGVTAWQVLLVLKTVELLLHICTRPSAILASLQERRNHRDYSCRLFVIFAGSPNNLKSFVIVHH